jgi:sulfatase modifying factor 1
LGASVVDIVTRRVQAWAMTFVTRTISALRAIFLPLGLAKVILWLGIGLLLSVPAMAQAPVVSNVVAQQRSGTKLVDITYDVTAVTPTVSISLRISNDGGASYNIPATTLSGAVGANVTIGTGKVITWNAGVDWNGNYNTGMRFEVTADDGVIAPSITMQPSSQTVISDSTATLTVAASGSGPINYQWYKGTVGTTITPVGTNSASFTTPALTETTNYWVRVSNTAGIVNSSLAKVSTMVIIREGNFTMGRSSADLFDVLAPQPVTVYISNFYMDKIEVTKELWDEVRLWAIANNFTIAAPGEGQAANHPVTGVSWWDVMAWCNARSFKEGLRPCYLVNRVYVTSSSNTTRAPNVDWTANGYRLPTQAEWEKAARGGVSDKRYPWGSDWISHTEANFDAGDGNFHPNYSYGYIIGSIPYYQTIPYTSPVGSFVANNYGLHDMAGNVEEWCWNLPSPVVDGAIDPRGDGKAQYQPIRGGGWRSKANECRVFHRKFYDSIKLRGSSDIGFRLVRSSI